MVLSDPRTLTLRSTERVPALGLGTWRMGEDPTRRPAELAALRRGMELGLTLLDTAESYAGGKAEELVGEAIAGRRDQVFLVSKVLPANATRRGAIAACERSLRRLGTERLDLYLLHWRGSARLPEVVEAFQELVRTGRIRHWGVSNFDRCDLERLCAIPGGLGVQVDQVRYSLAQRGMERELLPWCQARGLPVMAYSPIERGRLASSPVLRRIAARRGATAAQVALAWTLRLPGVCAVAKAATPAHVEENRGALDLHLSPEELRELEGAFPAPARVQPLLGRWMERGRASG